MVTDFPAIMTGCLGIVLVLLCSTGVLSQGQSNSNRDCKANSAADCLTQANINTLPNIADLPSYCPVAANLAYRINKCLAKCSLSPNSAITNLINQINSACSAGCVNLIPRFTNYTDAFDQVGGFQSVLDNIIASFNGKLSTVQLCLTLSNGRRNQKNAVGNCTYLQSIERAIYQNNPSYLDAQYICGSENVPIRSNSSNCGNSSAMAAAIQKQCDISCSIAATQNPDTICQLFQNQVDCILSNSVGCTAVEKQFLLPRLNSYAIANILLQCPNQISVRGVAVLPPRLSADYNGDDDIRCSYSKVLSDCFMLSLPVSPRPDAVEKLLNGNFPLDQFCNLQQSGKLNQMQQMTTCINSYWQCLLPVARSYGDASAYDNSYNISLGPFPLDAWGLNTILSGLTCPNPSPPTLCQIRSSIAPSSAATLRPTPTVTKKQTPPKPAKVTKLPTPGPPTVKQR